MPDTAEFPAPKVGAAPDFQRSPFIAFWETTRSCDLACAHCRADACTEPDPAELTVEGVLINVIDADVICSVPPVTAGPDAQW